jgi:hypothetical protein
MIPFFRECLLSVEPAGRGDPNKNIITMNSRLQASLLHSVTKPFHYRVICVYVFLRSDLVPACLFDLRRIEARNDTPRPTPTVPCLSVRLPATGADACN